MLELPVKEEHDLVSHWFGARAMETESQGTLTSEGEEREGES